MTERKAVSDSGISSCVTLVFIRTQTCFTFSKVHLEAQIESVTALVQLNGTVNRLIVGQWPCSWDVKLLML